MLLKKILVTGGAGYIGSHTCVALANAGYEPVILDNFSNSDPTVLERLSKILSYHPKFIQGDIRDKKLLKRIFQEHTFTAVIHFAGLKAVGESIEKPLEYYDINVAGSLILFQAMQDAGLKKLIFSSSAAVYSSSNTSPMNELASRRAANPYGHSKLIVEDILANLVQTSSDWNITCLRYFNPIGAHPSGLIGERPSGIPNNLMPYLTQVVAGLREKLFIFGNDYPTPDGTAIRDYIHVMDLAEGHIAALKNLKPGLKTFNLGTGRGSSVLELVHAFETATGEQVPYEIVARRAGDVPACWADPTSAQKQLNWKAKNNLTTMCCDSWHWQISSDKISETVSP